ncbi:MAG: hypothetical protein Kapaf2KO_09330 [Candidatus Kapaibacteriales bacterium]
MASNVGNAAKQGHPKGLYMLFFTEMWERFSFYGMRALLILYMTRQLLYSDEMGFGVYAAYGALVYATPFLGGLIADNILGYRKSVTLGAILMSVGHFLMAIEQDVFFFGALAFLIIGNGFFKPNISSMVGGLYEDGDNRRDAGFTIFYMGINLGAFLAPLVCGVIGEGFGWHYGFGLAGVGMLFGLIMFWRGQDKLGPDNGTPPHPEKLKKKTAGLSTEWWVYIASFAVVPLFGLLVKNYGAMDFVLTPFAVLIVIFLIFTALKSDKVARDRIFVILILLVFSTVFWAFFEQAGSSITLFTALNVDRFIGDFQIPASVFQSVNPAFIVLLAPLISQLWLKLQKSGKEPSTPVKFALGIIQLGLGFFMLVLGVQSSDAGMVPLFFLLAAYLLHTTGELFLSPVGLSMVTKLSPKKIVAMVMGAWFLSSAMAHHFGGVIATMTSTTKYMVPSLVYESQIGYTGTDTIKAYIVDSSEDEATMKGDPVDIIVNVGVDGEMGSETIYDLSTYREYKRLAEGEIAEIDLRVPFIDPTGEMTSLETSDISTGLQGNATINGEVVTYNAGNGSYSDTLRYTMCSNEDDDLCQNVEYIINVKSGGNTSPMVYKREIVYNMPEREFFSKFLGEAELVINANEIGYDEDGDIVSLEIDPEANMNGYVKKSKTLSPFMTAFRTQEIYSSVFNVIFISSLIAGGVLLLLTPLIRKWMHGIN